MKFIFAINSKQNGTIIIGPDKTILMRVVLKYCTSVIGRYLKRNDYVFSIVYVFIYIYVVYDTRIDIFSKTPFEVFITVLL